MCNKDCLHCKYADCICEDTPTDSEVSEIESVLPKSVLRQDEKSEWRKRYMSEYYEAHKEERRIKRREYYLKNRERFLAKQREYDRKKLKK